MSHDSWTCLEVVRGPGLIPDTITYAFKMAACRLYKQQRDQMLFQTDECSGLIKTLWKTYQVGARTGVLFKADVETNGAAWQVNFLLNTEDLQVGAERLDDPEAFGPQQEAISSEYFPVADLYEFDDLRPRFVN